MTKHIPIRLLVLALLFASRFPAPAAEPQLTTAQQIKLDEAKRLNTQALDFRSKGKFADGVPPAQQALAIQKEVLGGKHPDYATSLNNLAVLYESMGDYAKAEPLYRQALAIHKEILGDKDPDYVTSLNNLAVLYYRMGDYAKAEPLFRQALAIDKEVLGEKHREYAADLNNLAALYDSMGDYAKAEPVYRQALAIRKEVLGEKHPDYATSLNNLAALYERMGDYAKAEPLFQQALAICNEILGDTDPDYVTSLNNLAVLYYRMGDYAKAEPLFRQALSIRQEVLGKRHPDYATSLNNLAALYERMGDYAKAEPLYRQALAIRQEVLGGKHPDYATSLNNLAALYDSMGDYAKAEPLYRQALAIRKEVLGEKHPDYATSLNNLAASYAAAAIWQPAAANTDEARRVVRRHVARVLPSLSAKEQATFLRVTDEGPFHAALSLGLHERQDQRIVAQSASWLANGKAVAQEALAQRALLARESDNPEVADRVKQLEEIRRQLASLVYAAPKPGQEAARREQIEQLESQENDLGRRIASATEQSYQPEPWIEPSTLRQAIPAGGMLIDIARFRVCNFAAKGKEKLWQPAHYAAWLVPPAGKGEIKIVDLGAADKIEKAVQAVRSAMQRAMGSGNEQGEIVKQGEVEAQKLVKKPLAELANLVWEPLAKEFGNGTKQIILSPDAALWLVPWGALTNGNDKYVIEEYQIRYLVSGRDVVAQQTTNKATTQPVVFADPNYDLGPSQVESATRSVLRGILASNDELRSLSGGKSATALPKVGRLNGTAAEAAAIKPKLASYVHQEPLIYLDQYATEGVFKALHRPQVLVLSTHGFFLSDQEVRQNEISGTTTGQESRGPKLAVDGKPVENPLLRCGLLLAGCNANGVADKASRERQRAESTASTDDGILTGMEIVGTDLRGTVLVVLSACETGLGQVRNGEGVAGLRQAFQLAGAKSVVATLWQIPDKDSAQLMSQFFTNLAAGQAKADALRNAQLTLIEAHRQRFAAAHPFFWAAFTITGE